MSEDREDRLKRFRDSLVVDLGEYRYTKASMGITKHRDSCKHKHLTIDEEGEIVTCDDCGFQVGAFWALSEMVSHWKRWTERLEHRLAEVKQLENSHVVLKAAKNVETAWRSRKMVPCCPHCGKGIFPQDGFGNGRSISRELENTRRKKGK